ncbi:MAG TPA: hypothetical protein VHZ96_12370 [Frankiaceae bacterium]|jgi:tRNA (Thr-GGU) A37 N-methylase|nr:hypothetical protein [Frankiaceae bacterium]
MGDPAATMTVEPLGWVRSSRTDPIDDAWDGETSYIDLNLDRLAQDSTAGLDAFSHIEVIYRFHAAPSPNRTGRTS